MKKQKYKRISELGLKVKKDIDCEYVNSEELQDKLKKLNIVKQFDKYFGIQTCSINGPYASDVESVLERISSGKLTGTQLFWD